MQRRSGFTLIELLVVIAIIGILATLVITQLSGARVKARNSSAKSDITEAGKAVEVLKAEDLSGEKPLDGVNVPTAVTTGSSANPNGFLATASANGCSLAAAASPCHVSNLNNTTAGAGWATIFSGTQTVVGGATGNSYGVAFSKTPGSGYMYFYESADTGAVSTAGALSANSGYYFIADLGPTGAGVSGETARYYYVHNGNSGNSGATTAGYTATFTAAGL